MRWQLALAIALAACACGDKQPHAQNPQPPTGNDRAVTGDADSGDRGAASARDAGADAPLTADECRAFVDHVFEIAVREFRAGAAEQGKPIPSEGQLQQIREGLQKELGPECLRQPRSKYDCAMKARDRASLEACAAPSEPVDN